ncbi:MAG: protein-tyrosine phosphatase family protein [Chloroflexota bacterium]
MDLANRESPDFTWVADDLAIGSQVMSDEWLLVGAAGVGAIVDCRAEASDPADLLASLGIAFLHLPTRDCGDFNPEQVREGVAWVEQRLAEGRRVLVHCQAGKGRSVLIGAAVLTRRGLTPDGAVALIRERRPIVTPTPGQIARLREFAERREVEASG